jgi:general secretion pathway protein G
MDKPCPPNEAVKQSEAGFSLVELMVVVFIMGLLATLIIINVAPVGEQSRVNKARADISAVESALEMYSLDMRNYPSSDLGLAALQTAPNSIDTSTYRPGGYIKRLRVDPWGNDYQYALPGERSGGRYDVFSLGPDGQANTEDDIGNWGQ